MSDKTNKIVHILTSPRYWMVIAGIGIWIIVLQNFGFFGEKSQKVYVTGGYIKVDGSVSVDNTIDVNLSEINGRSDVFFNNPRRGDHNKYYVIPVTVE